MRAKLPVLFAILSLGFYVFCLLVMKNGAEDIISRLISQGNYDTSYHYIDGWAYDYTGVNQFLNVTGIFLAVYYGARIFCAIKEKKCETAFAVTLACYIVCVTVIAINQFHLLRLILAAAAIFVALAVISLVKELPTEECEN